MQLSASANLLEKRVSYLAAGLCFSPEHEFRMMLVNRLQRDLQSSNVLEVAIALSGGAKILTADMIPAVLPQVVNLLKHDQEIIRKKAVMLLHRFHQLQPDSVSHLGDKFRRALCDKDPAVMGASLHVFHDMLARAAGGSGGELAAYKDLVSSFVSILKQITEHRLPRDFDYHRIPAPWVQMRLLRILALLGRADQAASEQMYEVLLDVMRRADTGINVGYAIIYEAVRTVTTIYPNAALLDAAASAIGRFIASENHNLKFLGVTGLAAIVRDHPRYAASHQLAVIDCLEDPDDTLKRRTLDLLYRMTNPVNVTVIVDKLMAHLKPAGDPFLRADLVARITAAAERYAPSNGWYVRTMLQAFELGGDLVKGEVAQNMLRLLAEGGGESEEADASLRRDAVDGMVGLLDKPALPDTLLQVMFWSLGEYGYLASPPASLPLIADKVAALAQRAGLEVATRGYALSALLKLAAQCGGAAPASVSTLIAKLSSSAHVDLAQRCHEFAALAARPALMKAVLPVDASSEDIDVDEALAFLQPFVAAAEAAGARPYAPPAPAEPEHGAGTGASSALKFDAYAAPDANPTSLDPLAMGTSMGMAGGMGMGGMPGAGGLFPPAGGDASGAGGAGAPSLGLHFGNVKGAWGREGYRNAAGNVLGTAPAGHAAGPAGGAGGYDAGYGAGASSAYGGSSSAGYGAPAAPEAAAAAVLGTSSGSAASSGSVAAAVAPAPVAPPAPRELTEREKLAASLFGGVVPGGGASSGGGSGGGGLFGGMGGGSGSSASAGVGAGSSAGVGMRRAGIGAGAAAPAVAVAPAVTPAAAVAPVVAPVVPAAVAPPAPTGDLLDIFGGPAPAAAASAAPAANPLGDLFGGPAVAAVRPAGPALNPAALTVPAPLFDALGGAAAGAALKREPAAAAGNAVLGDDGVLSLSAHRIIAPDALHIALFVAHTGAGSPGPATNVTLTLTGLPYVSVTAARAHPPLAGAAAPAPGNGVALPLGSIAPGAFTCVLLSAVLVSPPPAGTPGGAMRASISYGNPRMGGAPAAPLSAAVDIPNADALRPTPMDTAAFGGLWTNPAMRGEAAASVPTPPSLARLGGAPLDAFMGALGPLLNLHPVQAIAASEL